jgi:hypothetical protein
MSFFNGKFVGIPHHTAAKLKTYNSTQYRQFSASLDSVVLYDNNCLNQGKDFITVSPYFV